MDYVIQVFQNLLAIQLPVPEILATIHWWIGAIFIVLSAIASLLIFGTGVASEDIGLMFIAVFLFFVLPWITSFLGFWLALALLLVYLSFKWQHQWRFRGWKKY